MSNEPNSPIVLRTVKHAPIEAPKPPPQTGIAFECPTQTKCPQCKGVVPLANAAPLTHVACPTCEAKVFVPARVGNFLLTAHIGEGEMGAIYRATDESLFREVAIKLVRGCLADDRESRERLRREACAAGKLNHPRVAQVHALNFSNGHPYLVMELVTGEDFSQKLEREGRIDERTVLRMALDVAEGLSALNREGLIHGDIKPGNIVLDRDGNAKLVDFGLSGMTRRDSSGNFVGTPDYIAPELLRGETDNHRSDLFSLGATLYHLLSGKPPFEGKTAEDVLKARVLKQAAPIGKVAKDLSAPTQKLVMRMLALHPAKRPVNSEEVAADIRDALSRLKANQPAVPPAGGATSEQPALPGAAPARRPERSLSATQRRRLITALLCLVATIELAVAVKQKSFEQTFEWLRQERARRKDIAARQDGGPSPGTAAPVPAATGVTATAAQQIAEPQTEAVTPEQKSPDYVKVVGRAVSKPRPQAAPSKPAVLPAVKPGKKNLLWQSINLGSEKPGGSTMQRGDTLIVQGGGSDMWTSGDRCRFVWTKVAGNYTFSAQVKAISDNASLALSGLLVKGEDPAASPGVLFGFLGSGELFLQLRQTNAAPVVVKRSERPVRLPSHLQLVRRGNTFEARVSADGLAWVPFASCDLPLPPSNTIGFAVSADASNTLATAKFDGIHVLTPGPSDAADTNSAPATVR